MFATPKLKKRSRPDIVPPSSTNSFNDGRMNNSNKTTNGHQLHLRDRFKQQLLDSFSQFSRETSLHGLKRITSSIPLWLKIIWVFMILSMCVTLVFQLKYKFDSYWEAPISLYINVRYETSVPFPAVILCNANLFRISETTTDKWHKVYNVINSVYRDPTYDVKSSKYYDQLKELDGPMFMKAAAHQKENLILSCQWPNGKKCSHEDFRTVVTDYGVCYAINEGHNHSEVLNVTNSGSGYGLYLVLNAEDYEAMSGPQKTVGVKVLIYKQGEIPLITEQGFDVAPGFQTSVGLKHREINKLQKTKGGDCGVGKLYLFTEDSYSSKICTLDRKYYAAVNACNCLPYMVKNGVLNRSMCDGGQFFGCMINASQAVPLTISKEECPQDCLSFEYQQYVSFSELSTLHIDNVLTSKQRGSILQQYLISREARSRHTEMEIENDAVLAHNLLTAYNVSENNFMVPGTSFETIVDPKLINVTCYQYHITPLLKIDQFCSITAIEAMLTKNLERLLLPELKDNIQRIIRELNNSANVFLSFTDMITRYFDQVSYQSLNFADFDKVQRIVLQTLYIENCKNVLKLTNQTLEMSLKDVGNDIKLLQSQWNEVENISSLRQFNRSDRMIPSLVKSYKCLANLFSIFPRLDEMTSSKMLHIKNRLQVCSQVAEQCIRHLDAFQKIFSTYQDVTASYKSNHTFILDHIKTVCNKFNRIRDTAGVTPSPKITRIDEYYQVKETVLMFLNRTKTKANTSHAILEISQTVHFPQAVRTYFDDLKRYVTTLQNDLLKEVQSSFGSLINFYSQSRYADMLFMLFPETTKENVNVTELLIRANDCIPLMNGVLEELAAKADESIELYFKAFIDLKDELQQYNNSLNLDMQFFKNNLLALNIYLREMSTEVLAQRLSYDSWSLLSDIGGTLGLFLGASLLTMGEILEYLINQFLFVVRYGRRTTKMRHCRKLAKLSFEQACNLMAKPVTADFVCENNFTSTNDEKSTGQFDITVRSKKQPGSGLFHRRSVSLGEGQMFGRHEYYL